MTCPACGYEYPSDDLSETTCMLDHGVCRSCKTEMLHGERCWQCYEVGHASDACPNTIELEEDMP